MATRTWKKERAAERIDTWLENMPLTDIEIKEFVRDTELTNLPGNVAYRLDGSHLYADILNVSTCCASLMWKAKPVTVGRFGS